MAAGLQNIKRAVERLSLERLHELEAWLRERVAALDAGREPDPVVKEAAETVEERSEGGVEYRLVTLTCGTPGCKCYRGEGHGPYWYAYWSEEGRTKSRYLGREFVRVRPEAGEQERSGGDHGGQPAGRPDGG